MQKLKNNMKNKGVLLLLCILMFFSITFIAGQPPFPQEAAVTETLNIFHPIYPYIENGQNFTLYVHVTNSTNQLFNDTISCRAEFYNNYGIHILENDLSFSVNEFNLYVSPNNFTINGYVSYFIQCNSSSEIGSTNGILEVNNQGKEFDNSESLIYMVLVFGVLILFLLSFYFMVTVPYSNQINEKGAIIKITKSKYVKLALILLTWVLFTWLLNIMIGLSDNFVSLTMFYGFFGFMFEIMNRLALPLGVVIFVIAIFEIIRDVNILGNIKKFGEAFK